MAENQQWNAQAYAENARFVADLGLPVVGLLAPQRGEKILDLGCGDGALTLKLQQLGAQVVGVDPSAEMVAAAKKLGLDAKVMAAEDLPFTGEFDAVFTNAVLHWVSDIDKVLRAVKTALKPGGRFVGEFGGHGNVAAISTALIAVLQNHGIDGAKLFPWYFPTGKEFSQKLNAAGFKIESVEIIPRLTPLKTGMRNWLQTFANPFVTNMSPEMKARVLDEVVALLKTSLADASGNWLADYVRLRFACRSAA